MGETKEEEEEEEEEEDVEEEEEEDDDEEGEEQEEEVTIWENIVLCSFSPSIMVQSLKQFLEKFFSTEKKN